MAPITIRTRFALERGRATIFAVSLVVPDMWSSVLGLVVLGRG